MAEAILVPQVGQDLTEAMVVALHVKLGDIVAKGDIVAEVESEKAAFEVEAFAEGVVIALPWKVGEMAKVLEPLLILGGAGERADALASPVSAPPSAPVAEIVPPSVGVERPAEAGPLRSSPLARRMAAAKGLDLSKIKGTGPRGARVLRDVEAASAIAAAALPQRQTAAMPLNLRVLQEGAGHPVVFVHGFGSDLSSWRPFIGRLGIGNPMIALDLPGHGGSVGIEATGFAAVVDQVASALLAAGHARLHLVGHSLGAAVAAALADRGDLDVRSLVLISPAGLGPKINGDFFDGFTSATSEAALAAWMHRLVAAPSSLPGAMIRATLAAREGTGLALYQSRIAATLFEGSTQLFSIRDALRRYAGPCRIVSGRQDVIIPADPADLVPGNVAVNRLEDVGHLPQIEAATLVGRLVAETVRAAL